MRLDTDDEGNVTVVLSERNLLVLLSKLYTPGSACTITGDPIDCPLAVKAEPDDVHYAGRAYSPGRMHPVAEKLVEILQEYLRDNDEQDAPNPVDMPGNGMM